MIKRLALLAFGIVAVSTCTPDRVALEPSVAEGEPIAFEEIASGILTSVREPSYRVILDQDAWTAAWSEFIAGNYSPPPPPSIDFGTRIVIFAAAGQLPTQLVSYKIDDVRLKNGELQVTVHQDWPSPRCGSLPVITYPVHVISVPRVSTTVTFITEVTDSC